MAMNVMPKSGAISKGYNFPSTWDQNAPLSDEQKAATLALSNAVSECPFPSNLPQENLSGKEGNLSVLTDESSFEKAGSMDGVLVNTHQFCKWYAELESSMKSEMEEKYRLYEDTLTERIQICNQVLQQVDETLNLINERQSLHQSVATKTRTLNDAYDQLVTLALVQELPKVMDKMQCALHGWHAMCASGTFSCTEFMHYILTGQNEALFAKSFDPFDPFQTHQNKCS